MQTLEGTWEEVERYASRYKGKRFRLTILDPKPSHISKRDFLRLPLEERRRILEEQAEIMRPYYEQNTEWREFLSGDIVEYTDESDLSTETR